MYWIIEDVSSSGEGECLRQKVLLSSVSFSWFTLEIAKELHPGYSHFLNKYISIIYAIEII